MAFTPGPWTAVPAAWTKKGPRPFEHGRRYDIMTEGRPGHSMFSVATVSGPSNEDMLEECQANAKIIAAAPDLLAALRKIVNNWDNLHSKDRAQARAAIAKATGEETT